MTRSSPSRRSQLMSSPERNRLSIFLGDDRNNESSHLEALAAAQKQHDRVREAAIRVYQLHELQEEQKRIAEQERQEKERLRVEAEIAAEEERLNELRAKSIPKPAPIPEPQPEPEKKTEPKPEPKVEQKAEPVKQPEIRTQPQTQPTPPIQSNGFFNQPKATETKPPAQPQKPIEPAAAAATASPSAFTKTESTPAAKAPVPVPPQAQAPKSPRRVLAERYYEIHKELKKLRKFLTDEAKRPGSPLKGKLGQARRDIRMAIGQLVGVKGGNAQPANKITTVLKETLDGTMASPPIPVSTFVTDNREPREGATHNGDSLPALFLYLMNIFSKGIINQFINEGGANPKAADPIGVFTAQIFSNTDFQWRGRSLIDILMAKYCVVCPALFGFRGNDRMEKGRLALGWRKDGPSWIPEQTHNDRMTGLGAGFASISLRDFSKSKKENPYPPTNYWTALASIVNTPQGETSNTQYVVVRAMVDGHEQRFLNFYGNAALAALKLALVEFPKKAPENAASAGSLRTLADVLRADGLNL